MDSCSQTLPEKVEKPREADTTPGSVGTNKNLVCLLALELLNMTWGSRFCYQSPRKRIQAKGGRRFLGRGDDIVQTKSTASSRPIPES